MVYKPSEDTFLMLDLIGELNLNGKEVLDMGTGNGEIALKAAEQGARVTAVDIDPEAISYTLEKIKRESKSDQVTVKQSDLFENVDKTFDVIFFNPPYVPSTEKNYVDLDGGETGNEVAEKFLESADKYLKDKGCAYLLTSSLGDQLVTENRSLEEVKSKSLWFEDLTVWKFNK